ncbi:hypothetical protein [Acidithiobacillus caldus]|uniref:Uncharacterized protein n=1 Tax=Acidithiobacillus caldus TaxID=33059 RepID=A0A1E7YPZ6_9PROT|nr:hypothetical protein [Acidithiobacillus caldus]OFC37974.1 hypothetical protein BAE27_03245 [Acidithiobacillus caldus]OFC38415.1 hypothetical protein BAE28_05580 [Acidithiobacillus caldus]OFC40011.1 hypothetical protein BAE29_06195 [Acidithiobacillus caldus]OFC60485.1 hypothetical protein BAE30_08070 [Acidithiobacillus caldus]
MSLHCPECGSEDVYRVAVAYEKGVQKTRSKTFMGGGLLSLFGPAFGIGAAVTRGRNTTLLAERLAPPQKAHPILVAIITFFAVCLLGFPVDFALAFFFGGIGLGQKVGLVIGGTIWLGCLIGLPIYALYKGFQYNLRLPKAIAEWNNLYTCDRCGHVFTKEAGQSITANKPAPVSGL